MSTTHMPGFTAEASLYTTAERYRLPYFSTSVAASGKVLPQICFSNEGGTTCCNCWGDGYGGCYCHRQLKEVEF